MHAFPSSPYTHLSRWEGFTFIATIKHSNAVPFTQGHESLEKKNKKNNFFLFRQKKRKKTSFLVQQCSGLHRHPHSPTWCDVAHCGADCGGAQCRQDSLQPVQDLYRNSPCRNEWLYHWRGSRGGQMKDRCNQRYSGKGGRRKKPAHVGSRVQMEGVEP